MSGNSIVNDPQSIERIRIDKPDTSQIVVSGPVSSESASQLLNQLAAARSAFRQEQQAEREALASERERLVSRRKQTRSIQQAARKDRQRIKNLYARFLKRMKEQWSTQRIQVEGEREHLVRVRATLVSEAERLGDIRTRFAADADAYKSRLFTAWELLSDSQRRLLADRQEAEDWITRQTAHLETRAAELTRRERQIAITAPTDTQRAAVLTQELQGLETRIEHTRAVLFELEQQRDTAEMIALDSTHAQGHGIVSLTASLSNPGRAAEADQLLTQLQLGEQELQRERMRLNTVRQDLERRSRELADERTVLTEQAAALAMARNQWHTAESHTIDELETLTREIRVREQAAEEMLREAMAADRIRRAHAYQAWQLQVKLEAWQTALTEHETAAQAASERQEADLDARREQLAAWEQSLEKVARTWSDLREQERTHLHGELEQWSSARQRYVTSAAAFDTARETFLDEARRAAAASLAAEESTPSTGKHDERRVRVLRKKWERHFDQFRKDLDRRRAEASRDMEVARERLAELHQTLERATEKQSELQSLQTDIDRSRLVTFTVSNQQNRDMSLEAARRQAIEAEVIALRAEVHHLSAALRESVSASC